MPGPNSKRSARQRDYVSLLGDYKPYFEWRRQPFGFAGGLTQFDSFGNTRAMGTSRDLFPLTPALGEREPRIPSPWTTRRLGSSQTWQMSLPLPEGEGWGEGERGQNNGAHGYEP
jgi:hypothetical protein